MRVRRLTATLALSALALSGCSGGGEGEETTSSTVKPTVIDPSGDSSSASGSSSSSTSGSSTSSTSEADADGPPEEAKANTKEGAEAFAKWYLEAKGESLTDGDITAIKAATSPDCAVCRKAYETTAKDAKDLGLVQSNPYKVNVVRSAQDELGVWRVKLRVSFDDYIYVKDGQPNRGVRADSFEINPELDRTDSGWLVRDWLLIP